MTDAQKKRGESAALKAIGKTLRVRTGPMTTVSGTISACRPVDHATEPGKTQYEVTLVCGSAAVERVFTVSKLA